jgi:hypothetical protein
MSLRPHWAVQQDPGERERERSENLEAILAIFYILEIRKLKVKARVSFFFLIS